MILTLVLLPMTGLSGRRSKVGYDVGLKVRKAEWAQGQGCWTCKIQRVKVLLVMCRNSKSSIGITSFVIKYFSKYQLRLN